MCIELFSFKILLINATDWKISFPRNGDDIDFPDLPPETTRSVKHSKIHKHYRRMSQELKIQFQIGNKLSCIRITKEELLRCTIIKFVHKNGSDGSVALSVKACKEKFVDCVLRFSYFDAMTRNNTWSKRSFIDLKNETFTEITEATPPSRMLPTHTVIETPSMSHSSYTSNDEEADEMNHEIMEVPTAETCLLKDDKQQGKWKKAAKKKEEEEEAGLLKDAKRRQQGKWNKAAKKFPFT